MNRFLAWLDGLSNLDAIILVLLVFIVSIIVTTWLFATGHLATVLTIIVILLTIIAVMILRGNR